MYATCIQSGEHPEPIVAFAFENSIQFIKRYKPTPTLLVMIEHIFNDEEEPINILEDYGLRGASLLIPAADEVAQSWQSPVNAAPLLHAEVLQRVGRTPGRKYLDEFFNKVDALAASESTFPRANSYYLVKALRGATPDQDGENLIIVDSDLRALRSYYPLQAVVLTIET